jgi:hypothetical protein
MATPRLAARHLRRPPGRAGGTASAARGQRLPAEAGQRQAVATAGEKAVWTSYPSW